MANVFSIQFLQREIFRTFDEFIQVVFRWVVLSVWESCSSFEINSSQTWLYFYGRESSCSHRRALRGVRKGRVANFMYSKKGNQVKSNVTFLVDLPLCTFIFFEMWLVSKFLLLAFWGTYFKIHCQLETHEYCIWDKFHVLNRQKQDF